jgi:hypothetical protein
MPFYTKNYNIPFFRRGDAYSASIDQSRFKQIDEELNSISSVISTGVISGLNVEQYSSNEIIVKSGVFCINGKIYNHAIDEIIYFESSQPSYVYINSGASQQVVLGAKSAISSVEYVDSIANLPVSSVDFESISPYNVKIKFNENLPADYSKITIYRSFYQDLDSAEEIGTVFAPSIEYDDIGIVAGNTYYYWFKLEDVNGIVSDFSDFFVYTAQIDMGIPAPPTGVVCYPAHRSVGVTWEQSVSRNINYYQITYTHQDEVRQVFLPSSASVYVINNLTNGYPVFISIKVVTFSFIESETININSVPVFNPGARDVDSISCRFLTGAESGGTTSILLEWTNPVIDPNLPDKSIGEIDELSGKYDVITKYIIWEIRGSGAVSIQSIPTIASNDQVAIINNFTYVNGFGNNIVQPLKDNSYYLIKLYRMVNGREGVGRYVYVKTGDVTPPVAVSSVSATLLENGAVNFSWFNEKILEIYKQEIKIQKAIINSTTYDYSAAATVYLKFTNKLTGPSVNTSSLAYALFVDNFPFRIGISNGYLIVEIDQERVDAGLNAGSSLGLNLIQSIDIIAPPEGIYLGINNLNLLQLRDKIDLLYPILEVKWNPSTGRTVTYLKITDFIDIRNVSGIPDNEIEISSTIDVEPKFPSADISFADSPDAVIFYGLNPGYSFEDIAKYVSLGNVELVKIDFIGQVSFYNLAANFVNPSTRYYITISVYDFASNKSAETTYFYDTPALWQILPPSSPSRQTAFIDNELIKVAWAPSVSDYVNGYKILRAKVSGEFSLSVEEISSLIWEEIAFAGRFDYEYVDYTADYGQYYVYRVTTVGILGKVSPSFYGLNENGQTTAIIKMYDLPVGELIVNLNIVQNNDDVNLIISNKSSTHDGYIIYRSFNKGVYVQIGSISASSSNYVDKNILIYSGTYSYCVRPISTESFVLINAEEIDNAGILLAKVTKINESEIEVENLSSSAFLLSSYLLSELQDKILEHKHLKYDEVFDFRVNLEQEYVFSSFETDNNQRFYVLDEIPNMPESYQLIVLLNGELSSVAYTFNIVRKILKFNTKLAPMSGETFSSEPYQVLPEIKLIINPGGETFNNLPEERISSLFAQQIGSGKVNTSMIPDMFHSGLKGDKLKPTECLAESLDGFKFLVTLNEKRNYLIYNSSSGQYSEISEYEYNEIDPSIQLATKVGFPLNKTRNYIIYDALNIVGTENFILCTNRGVLYYYQNGGEFRIKELISSEPPSDSGPCHRIFYFSAIKIILCLSFRSFDIIKITDNGDAVVTRTDIGLNFNCHVFRDAVHTVDGTFYVTSDIGLLKIDLPPMDWMPRTSSSSSSFNQQQLEPKITQLGFVSGQSTDIYSIWKSADNSTIYISTEIGIFESSNGGLIFSRINNYKNMPRLWHVFNYQGTLFAVSDHSVWRKREDENTFKEIYKNSKVYFRKFIIKYGRLIFTTSDGIYRSDSVLYAKYYDTIKLSPINVANAENGKRKIVYSLVDFGPYVIACMEGKTMLMYSLDRYSDHIDLNVNVVQYGYDDYPLVYLNNEQIDLGVYFQYSAEGLSNDCVFFDFNIDETSSVKIIRQYAQYMLPSGGWARRDFAASCFLYKNNIILNDGSRAEKPVNQIAYYSDLVHSLDDTVSDIDGVESNLVALRNQALFTITNKINDEGIITEYGIHRFTRNNIRNLIDKIDIVNSNIYDIEDGANMGILSSLRIPYPSLNVDLIANVLPSPYGVQLSTLISLGINYEIYNVPTYEGTLGTYDPEDPTYYLPPIPLAARIDGVDQPNYNYQEDETIDDGLDIPYSGFYSRVTDRDSNALGGVGGRNTPGDGTIDGGGGTIGGGGGGGGGMAS